jgi:hypothetical protein
VYKHTANVYYGSSKELENMSLKKKSIYTLMAASLLVIMLLSGCQTEQTAGQLMMDVTGESFPIEKKGMFSKDHEFWVFKIQNVGVSGTTRRSIKLKGTEQETISRAFGLSLKDPEGYEWDIVGLAELTKGRRPGDSRAEKRVTSYEIKARMEESATMAIRFLHAQYQPGEPGFDGTLRGNVTKENNEVLYTFESNARLDTYDKPDDGLLVFSIDYNGTPLAVVDSREGYEVTFFEGLQPAERTQMASTISTLFVLMKYGIL